MKHWCPPGRWGLCNENAHLRTIVGFVTGFEASATHQTKGVLFAISPFECHGYFWTRSNVLETPQDGKGYAVKPRTCKPLQILSPALKLWAAPRRYNLCIQVAYLLATLDFIPCFDTL